MAYLCLQLSHHSLYIRNERDQMWLLKSETRLMTISTTATVSCHDVLKILYLPFPRNGVNKHTCLHLVSHLVSHTHSLPVSLRSMNNFMVGFLNLKNVPVSITT
uniref:Uncharacterized protein n=1 Tax=Branchiostoma floridae TaxID=7739 RepID=C3YI26_BRAFL|eukprot:XP_002604152.1 hypothetical protein BRAFLDRAFT_71556 [Branchiostoma floridae]